MPNFGAINLTSTSINGRSHPDEPMNIEESEVGSDCSVLDLDIEFFYDLKTLGTQKIMNGFMTREKRNFRNKRTTAPFFFVQLLTDVSHEGTV